MVSQPKNPEFRFLNSYLLHVLHKIVTQFLLTRADAARDFKPCPGLTKSAYVNYIII